MNLNWNDDTIREQVQDEAIAAFSQEMGNSLMILQNGLDQLRTRFKDEDAFQWMQGACNQASNTLHSTISIIGGHSHGKENFFLGEFMEQLFPELQQGVPFALALRTHDNCQICASKRGLGHSLQLLLQHVQQEADQELYIEVYRSEQDEFAYGVLTLNIIGSLQGKDNRWKMLKTTLLLQGVQLLEEPHDEGIRCHLMLEAAAEIQAQNFRPTAVESSTALIVENEPRIAEMISKHLYAYGMRHVEVIHRPQEALEWLAQHSPSLALIEYNLPGMSGWDLIQQAKPALQGGYIGLMAGHHVGNLQQEMQQLGLHGELLMKPFRGDDLSRIVMGLYVEGESAAPKPASVVEPAADSVPESFNNTMRLKTKPKNQQCPPGFAPDLA